MRAEGFFRPFLFQAEGMRMPLSAEISVAEPDFPGYSVMVAVLQTLTTGLGKPEGFASGATIIYGGVLPGPIGRLLGMGIMCNLTLFRFCLNFS